jgi:hypothetical protein
MWVCSHCNEVMGGTFDACWNCGASIAGEANPEFEVEEPVEELRGRQRTSLRCLRCDRGLVTEVRCSGKGPG